MNRSSDPVQKSEGTATPAPPPKIDSTFRNGSLTSFSVIIGFSLSFLTRWAELPGEWRTIDVTALATILVGCACQIAAMARLLFFDSLLVAVYGRSVRLFLIGLGLVSLGVALTLVEDLVGADLKHFGL